MSVTFFNRLLVLGTPAHLREFQQRASRTYEREVLGKEWTEIIPISFVALHELTPLFDNDWEACDPLEIRSWPLRRLGPGRAELRFQFETRNMEAQPVFRRVAPKFPALTFRLVTMCLDDGEIDTWQMRGRKVKARRISKKIRSLHWAAASRKFKAPVDELYDDDDACDWVEFRLCDHALNGWERAATRRRWKWWNIAPLHTLNDERTIAMAMLGAIGQRKKTRRPGARTKGSTRRAFGRSRRTRCPGRRRPDGLTEDVRGEEAPDHRRISRRPVRGEPQRAAKGASGRPCCRARGGRVHQLRDARVPPAREAHCRVQSWREQLFLSPHERRYGSNAQSSSGWIRYESRNDSIFSPCRPAGRTRAQADKGENRRGMSFGRHELSQP